MSKIKKGFLLCCLILFAGGLGGVLAERFFFSFLVTFAPFSEMDFFQRGIRGTTIINPVEKITITENTAIEEAIDKVRASLVLVRAEQGQKTINQTTGFIVTGDGLIITSSDVVGDNQTVQYSVLGNNNIVASASLVKVDLENNLALFKVEEQNLPVVSLVNLEDLRLGQRVVLVAAESSKNELNYFVNLGIIRSIDGSVLKLNLNEYNIAANGSPLVDVGGKVIGLNIVSYKGLIKTISADKVRVFMGL